MDKKAKLSRAASRRRHARGVALVEGAVIFPMMALVLVYLELAHHSFDAYITAEHVANERVWSGATQGAFTGNCPVGRDDTSYVSKVTYFKFMDGANGSDDTPAGGGNPPIDTSQAGGVNLGGPSGWFLHKGTARTQVTVQRGGVLYDGATHQPNAQSEVFCNQGWAGGIISIIKSLF